MYYNAITKHSRAAREALFTTEGQYRSGGHHSRAGFTVYRNANHIACKQTSLDHLIFKCLLDVVDRLDVERSKHVVNEVVLLGA